MKKKISSDPRYEAVDSSSRKEDWFKDYVRNLEDVSLVFFFFIDLIVSFFYLIVCLFIYFHFYLPFFVLTFSDFSRPSASCVRNENCGYD